MGQRGADGRRQGNRVQRQRNSRRSREPAQIFQEPVGNIERGGGMISEGFCEGYPRFRAKIAVEGECALLLAQHVIEGCGIFAKAKSEARIANGARHEDVVSAAARRDGGRISSRHGPDDRDADRERARRAVRIAAYKMAAEAFLRSFRPAEKLAIHSRAGASGRASVKM